jgi:hypothetical protein
LQLQFIPTILKEGKNQKNFLKLKWFSAKHDLHKTAFDDEEKNQQSVSPQMMKPEI